MLLCRRQGQSMAEYAILLVILASVFMGMQVYVKRALQGRLRNASDAVVAGMSRRLGKNLPEQCEPYYRSSSKPLTQDSSLISRMFEGGGRAKDAVDLAVVEGYEEKIR